VAGPHIHVPYSRIPEYADFIREKRLDLEIYFGSRDLDSVSPDEIRGLSKILDYRPSLSFHGPFMDLSPAAVDSKVRKATTERFLHVLDIAEVLGPKTIVFHSGYEKWKYALDVGLWLEKSLLTWRPLNDRASAMGVKIAIENIFEDEPSNLRLLMEHMDSDNFGICFDTGHCNLFSTVPLTDWLEALNPHIAELHLHDNDGSADQHLPMGEGTFDFTEFFGLLARNDCVHTIEAHTPEHVLRSMEYLRAKGISSGSAS
jgi:sugar phosphate isomerase/epimerase